MRAALGYDRQYANAQIGTEMLNVTLAPAQNDDAGFMETDETEVIRNEDMCDGMRNRLKNKACGYRPFLKVVPDTRDNVGRRCSYTRNGENLGRVWELVTPMQDQEFVSYYLIRNTLTGEQHIVWDRLLHNLY